MDTFDANSNQQQQKEEDDDAKRPSSSGSQQPQPENPEAARWANVYPYDRIVFRFECNICLDTAKDAVISMCGHLFWLVRQYFLFLN